jgi:hypothetical protein
VNQVLTFSAKSIKMGMENWEGKEERPGPRKKKNMRYLSEKWGK